MSDYTCPNCGSTLVSEAMRTSAIDYGNSLVETVPIIVTQPVLRCLACHEAWTDHRGEEAREAAIDCYKRVFREDTLVKVCEIVGTHPDTLVEAIEQLKQRVKNLEAFQDGVNVALNSGDGSYRP